MRITADDLVYIVYNDEDVDNYIRKFVIDKNLILVIAIRDTYAKKPFIMHLDVVKGCIDRIIVTLPNNLRKGWASNVTQIKRADLYTAYKGDSPEFAYGMVKSFDRQIKRVLEKAYGKG